MRRHVALVLLLACVEVARAEPARPVEPTAFPVELHPRFRFDIETFATAGWINRSGPDLTEIRLTRAEGGATIGFGPNASAELRLQAIRSAGEGGTLGVDGDSLVLRVKRAQIVGDVLQSGVRFFGAAGLVGDPWIQAVEDGYTLRPLSAIASERLIDWNVSDLALLAGVIVGPVKVTVNVGNGEGLRYPERNDGKTTTGVVEAVPLVTDMMRLRIAAVGRDGSVGPGRVRDHRLGGSATIISSRVSAGLELVRAWGIDDRADLVATVGGGWAEVHPIANTIVAARGGFVDYNVGGRRVTAGGAVAIEPWHDAGRLRIWLALDRTTSSGTAATLPGADPGNTTTVMLIVSATAPHVID